jgi:predicted secreted protein
MTRPWFILSPCGTSLLTNSVIDEAERNAIVRCANSKSREICSAEDRQLLDGLTERMSERLANSNQVEVAKLSAELNAITKLYQGDLNAPQHFHQLLCTDTWLG